MNIYYLHLIWHNPSMTKNASYYTKGKILNFQNTFASACEEIRLEIKTKKYIRKSNLYKISYLYIL